MTQYQYIAKDIRGKRVFGRITAGSRRDALRLLPRKSLHPLRLHEVRGWGLFARPVSPRLLAAVYSRLSDLLQAGVPILRALELLLKQQRNPRLEYALSDICSNVADGGGLADSMAAHPSMFGTLIVSIVRAGEEGGFLEEALIRVAKFTEQREALKRKVMGALAYPLLLLCTGAIVLVCMLVFFVPKFTPIFDRLSDQEVLPWATTAILTASRSVSDSWLWVSVSAITVTVCIHRLSRSSVGRRWLDQMRMNMFVVGPLYRQVVLGRFCRVFGTLLRNDVPLVQSIMISRDSCGSPLIADALQNAASCVVEGKPLSRPLNDSGRFPDDFVEMVTVGENANNLDTVLLGAADSLDNRVSEQLSLFIKLLEPALLLVMAAVILFFLTGLLLPVFQSANALS